MIPRSFGTHSGTFHADDVTACSLLLLFNLIDRDKIFRTRDLKLLGARDYVCDVGGVYDPQKRRFDHHQNDYNGTLSSAGMVWKYLKNQEFVDEKTYDFFNRSLIWGVDAHDNGKSDIEPGVCTFSNVISNFVPIVHDAPEEELKEAFLLAVDFTHGHLQRLLKRFRYIEGCRQKIVDAMSPNKKYLFLNESMPWLDVFFDLGGEKHPALFVVMPSGKHWKLRCIPPNEKDKMKVRVPLPKAWAGLMDAELKGVSKIPGAIFCHKGRFISVWETKEDALQALTSILERL